MKSGAAGRQRSKAAADVSSAAAGRELAEPLSPSAAPLPLPPPASTRPAAPLDIHRVREDFPILSRQVRGKPLIYLDNAATTQKPRFVIDAVSRFYTADNANVHRGVHHLSEQATEAYEQVREQTARFLNAGSSREIVFTRGTTEAINLVAQSYGRSFLKADDEVLITAMEHHSNIVPWQLVCEQTGAILRCVPLTAAGDLDLEAFQSLLNRRTRLIALTHVSNALGTLNPIKRLIGWAHALGVPVLVDGAQSAPHLPVDVQDLDCDFFAFSGHKLFGPTGVGVLFGKQSLLEHMPPYQGGGGMITSVTLEHSSWAPVPAKFEAGTPMIAQVVGLGAALAYVNRVGLELIAAWEHELLSYATELVSRLEGVKVIGTARDKVSILSFVLDRVHPHDIGTVLDDAGIAIRAGHHCAQPAMRHFGVPATARASFAFYNTKEEAEVFADALGRVRRMFV